MLPKEHNDGRYYRMSRLNMVFALSSVLLLAAVIWLVWADYDREWKRYQREFQALEAEQAGLGEDSGEVPPLRWQDRLGRILRDLPLLDFAAPSTRIEQVVVQEVGEDLHFVHRPRVDRCMTCHQGILREEFTGAAQPFAAHPRLDLYLSSGSPHPVERFGCTACHGGHGRGTDFLSAGHTPADAAQEAEWRSTHNWAMNEELPGEMLPRQYAQASCLQCHAERQELPGAEKLMQGLRLIERAACASCHAMAPLPPPVFQAPSLAGLGGKTHLAWVEAWLREPGELNRDQAMPRFFEPGPGRDAGETDAEIRVIAEYLLRDGGEPAPAAAHEGNAARGREYFHTLGCLACHQSPEAEALGMAAAMAWEEREHGPELRSLHEKLDAAWLHAWLSDPQQVAPGTAMPDMRLSAKEAADLTAYLMRWDSSALADAPLETLELAEALEALAPRHLGASPQDAALLEAWPGLEPEAQVAVLGERLVRHYGCMGCHELPGINERLPVGPDLAAVGKKRPHELDFGARSDLPHTLHDWLLQKLAAPREFQPEGPAPPQQRLRMPRFDFDAEEREAIVTALLGLRGAQPENRLQESLDEEQRHLVAGQRLLRAHNCLGCHSLDGAGGSIDSRAQAWIEATVDTLWDDPEPLLTALRPPVLDGQGERVQSAWLFHYLGEPQPIRPWLEVRMPTFSLDEAARNAMTAYFSARAQEPFPFVAAEEVYTAGAVFEAGRQLFSPANFDCAICHVQGERLPAGTPDRWAPDLVKARERLKPEWVRRFLSDPQELLPGTRMPAFFDPEGMDATLLSEILDGDAEQQINALKNYVFAIGLLPQQGMPDVAEEATEMDSTASDAAEAEPLEEWTE